MRWSLTPLLALSFSLCACQARGQPEPPQGDARAPAFAVVELFTSEGCSSCPPADATVSRLIADARAAGQPVIGLAWHVDYWDRLGWPDPFSSPAHTARQEAYDKVLPRGMYTPQAVVNGRVDVSGLRGGALRHAVKGALAQPGTVKLTAQATREGTRWRVRYGIEGAPPGCSVLAVLTEDGLQIAVPRGENAGRTLRHDQVVRAFRRVPVQANGEVILDAPKGLRTEQASVVVLVEHDATRAVLAVMMPEPGRI